MLHEHQFSIVDGSKICKLQKFEVSKILKCFWKMSLMLTKAAFIDQKYCKNSNIVKTYFNYNAFCYNIFSNVIYSFDDQAEFSAAITSVIRSFINNFNMLIWCSRNISYFYQIKKKLAAEYFCGNHDTFCSALFDEEKVELSSIY